MKRSLCLGLVLFGTLAGIVSYGQSYSIVDLGAPLGTNSYAYGINNRGDVVGYCVRPDGAHAFIYNAGVVTDLGGLGGTNRYALSVNSSGQVVGFGETTNGVRAFLFNNGNLTNLGSLGGLSSYAYGINDSGLVVGHVDYTNGSRAYLYGSSGVSDLGTLGGINSYGFGVNNSNLVVGSSLTAAQLTNAFYWQGVGLSNLNDAVSQGTGWDLREARGVNSQGAIVGWGLIDGREEAFLFASGAVTRIGVLPGAVNSFAFGVNSSNHVVGAVTLTNGQSEGFLWADGQLRSLNDLLPANSGWELCEGRGINDAGQIVGWGITNGEEHAFLLTRSGALGNLNLPLNSLKVWLRADAGVVASGSGQVAQWQDQSSNHNDAAQTTLSSRPCLTQNAAVFNRRPSLHFYAASNQWFTLPAFVNGTNAAEAFVVLRAMTNRPSSSRALWRLGGASANYYPAGDGKVIDDFGSSSTRNFGLPSCSLTQAHLYNVVSRPGEWSARINGITQYATNVCTPNWSSVFYLGTASGNNFDGDIAEVMIFNRALSAVERDSVGSYLTQKYGLALAPSTPGNLRAWSISSSQVGLSWSASLGNMKTSFKVERSVDGISFGEVALVENSCSWIDTGLIGGVQYFYRVRASNYAGESGYSGVASARTLEAGADFPIGNLKLWLKGDAGHGTGAIGIWQDQTTNGNHATQSTLSMCPILNETGINGLPAIHFSASSNQWFTLPAFVNGTNAAEAFVVLRAATNRPASSRALWRLGSASANYYPASDGKVIDDFGSSSTKNFGFPSCSLTQAHIYNVVSRPGEWSARINGITQYATNVCTPNWSSVFYLGTVSGNNFDGDIAEVVIFNRALSVAEREAVGGYLTQKYGLASPPSNPANLRAWGISSSQVGLSWSASLGSMKTSFKVERSMDGFSFTQVAIVDNSCSFVDPGLIPGAQYFYRVRASNYAGESAFSDVVNATTFVTGADLPIGDLKLWLKGDAGRGNGSISMWQDQTTNANHATQSTLSMCPIVNETGINGMPALHFYASSNQSFTLPVFLSGTNAAEAFVVLKVFTNRPASARGLWRVGGASAGYYPASNGKIIDDFGYSSGRDLGLPSCSLTQAHFFNVVSRPGEWTARFNGITQWSTNINTPSWSSGFGLGSVSGNSFDGDVAEVMVFNRPLTGAERDAVGIYLAQKYGLAIAPATPTNLHAWAISASQVCLSWNGSLGSVKTSFKVERSIDGISFTQIAAVDNGGSYLDTGLIAGTQYFYRVRVSNYAGDSGYSRVASASTLTTGTDLPLGRLKLWLKGDAGHGAGAISSWLDQTTNGNNAMQSTLSMCPTSSDAGVNGKPSVHFSAAMNQVLTLPAFMKGTNQAEIFVVLKAATNLPTSARGLWRFGCSCYYPNWDGTISDDFGSGAMKNLGIPAQNIAQGHLYNVRSKPGEWAARINGMPQYSTTNNTVAWDAIFYLGAERYGSSFDGDIAEVMVFDRVLSIDERSGVETYLGEKYGLVGSSSLAPTNVSASTISASQIMVTWRHSAAGWPAKYLVERGTDGVQFQLMSVVDGATSYMDSGLSPNTTYYYRVRARASAETSEYSEIATGRTFNTGADVPVSNLKLWLRGDWGHSGGFLSKWEDQTTNGNSAYQTTATNRPFVVNNAINGNPAVHFIANSNHFFYLPTFFHSNDAAEVFAVLRASKTSPASLRSLWQFGEDINHDQYSGFYSAYPDVDGVIWDYFGSNARYKFAPAQSLDQFHIYNVTAQTNEWTARVNGNTQFNSTSNTISWSSSFRLGQDSWTYGYQGGYNTYFDGEIAELMVFDRALTAGQRSAVQSYLTARYALGQLPSTPVLVSASALSSNQIFLRWNVELSNLPKTYLIERGLDGVSFASVATITNACSYLDTSVSGGTQYYYRIKAANSAGKSGYSAVSGASTPPNGVGIPAGDLQLWLRADAGRGSGAVNIWSDQTTNHNDAVMNDKSAFRPSVVDGVLNGHPVMHFDGLIGQCFHIPALRAGNAPAEAFVVLRAATNLPSGQKQLWNISGWCEGAYPSADGGLTESFGLTKGLKIAPSQSLDQFHLYNVSRTSNSFAVSINGIQQHVGMDTNVFWASSWTLGGSFNNQVSLNGFDGDIAELMFFSRVLTPEERAVVQGYLNDRYAIAGISTCVSNLVALPVSESQIGLQWSANLTNTETAYSLERRTGGEAFNAIAVVRNSCSFIDCGLQPDTHYEYRLKAIQNGRTSDVLAEAQASTPTAGCAIPLADLKSWLKADSGRASGPVNFWLDQTGNGNNAVQNENGAFRPTAVENVLNGRPVIRFDGTISQCFHLPCLATGTDSGEVFVVLKADTRVPSTNVVLWNFSKWVTQQFPDLDGRIIEDFGTIREQRFSPSKPLDRFNIYNVSSGPNSSGIWLNGVMQDSGSSTNVFWSDAWTLGSVYNNQKPFWGFDGDIAEFMFFKRSLTDDERIATRNYLKTKYAIGRPAAPFGLSGYGLSTHQTYLHWSNEVAETQWTYQLERSSDGQTFSQISATTNGGTYIDSGLESGRQYFYRVKAINDGIASPYSDIAAIQTLQSGSDLAMGNLKLWLRGGSGHGTNAVNVWLDQSGNGNDAVQTNSGSMPLAAKDVATDKWMLRFSAAKGSFMNLNSFMNGAAQGEVFVVARVTSVSPDNPRSLWSLGGSGTTSGYPSSDGTISDGFGSSVLKQFPALGPELDRLHLYNAISRAGEWSARFNGIACYTTSNNVVAWGASPTLGRCDGFFDGDIAEVLVFDRCLEETERFTVSKLLMEEYGIEGNGPESPELKASPVSSSQISLTWGGIGNSGQTIAVAERSLDGKTFSRVFEGCNTCSWVDSGLNSGTRYYYRVKLSNYAGDSAFSQISQAETLTNGTTLPLEKTSLVLWLKADSGHRKGFVDVWCDQSGNNTHATQSAPEHRPLAVDAGSDGMSTIEFRASSQSYFDLPPILGGTSDGEIIAVLSVKEHWPVGNRGLWTFGTAQGGSYPGVNGAIAEGFGVSVCQNIDRPSIVLEQRHLYNVAVGQSAGVVTRIDGVTVYSNSTCSKGWSSVQRIGASSGGWFDGNIAEVLVFNRTLSASEREAVSAYLESKFKINVAEPNTASIRADAVSKSQISLSWSGSSSLSSTVSTVERSQDGSAFTPLITLTNAFGYVDTGLASSTEYFYRVKLENPFGQSEYSGCARASTLAEGSEMPMGEMRLWLAADAGHEGGSLMVWRDQSGWGNDAIQTNAASMPEVIDGAVNGRPVVRFDARNSEYFRLPTFLSGSNSAEAFLVVKAATNRPAQNRGLWRLTGLAGGQSYPDTNGIVNEDFGYFGLQNLGVPSQPLTRFHSYNVVSQPGEWTARMNGVVQYTTTNATPSWSPYFFLGYDYLTGSFDGDIAEVIVFQRSLTEGERNAVGRYIDCKYGLSQVPEAPANLRAVALSASQISLNWASVLTNWLTEFEVERGTNGVDFSRVAVVNNACSYIDGGLQPFRLYYYRVRAVTTRGASQYSPLVRTITMASGQEMPLSNMSLWLMADANRVVGPVSYWRDQSGSGNDAVQTSPTNMPQVVVGAINGKPVVRFNAQSRQYFTLPNYPSGSNSAEAFVVLKAVTNRPTHNRSLWRLSGFGGGQTYPDTNGIVREDFGFYGLRNMGVPSLPITEYHCYNVASHPGRWTARINGVVQYDTTNNTPNWLPNFFLGYDYSGGFFDGDIAEIIVYQRGLTPGEREAIGRYLDSKYALSQMPEAPVNFKAAALSATQINLIWESHLPGNESFTIERSVDGVTYNRVAVVQESRSMIDGGLSPGTQYFYRVKTSNYAGDSDFAWASAKTKVSGVEMPVTNMRVWLKADAGCGEETVSLWKDQSGSGNDATQWNDGKNAPHLRRNALNGMPVIHFDGAKSEYLTLPLNLMNGASSAELFLVVKAATNKPAADRSLWGGSYPKKNGVIEDRFGSSAWISFAPTFAVNEFHAYNVTAKAGEWAARIDGITQFSQPSNNVYFSTAYGLGEGWSCFDGDIAELIVYDRALTSDERNTVGVYLNQRYGFVKDLPDLPSNVVASAISPTQVGISWTSSLKDSTLRFSVLRSVDGVNFTEAAMVENRASFIDENLTPGTSYTYYVKAINGAGQSGYSLSATAKTPLGGSCMPIGSLCLWLSADNGLGIGPVATWRDRSGRTNNASQLCESNKPTLVQNAINQRPAVHFEAERNQFLSLAPVLSGTNSSDVFVVLKAASQNPQSPRALWLFGQADRAAGRYYPDVDGTISDDFGRATLLKLGTPALQLTNYHLYNVSSKPGSWQAWINTALQYSTTTNGCAWALTNYLGYNGFYEYYPSFFDDPGFYLDPDNDEVYGWDGAYFDGDIAEIMIFDRALNEDEREPVRSYLMQKYSLQEGTPAIPEDLSAKAISSRQIALTWSASADRFVIERSTNGIDYSSVASLSGTCSYIDSGLALETQYFYRVKAWNYAGESGYTDPVTAATFSDAADIPLVQLKLWLRGDAGHSSGQIVRWEDQSGSGNSFSYSGSTEGMPSVVEQGINGRAVIRFDSAKKQYLSRPAFLSGTDSAEVFVALRAAATTNSEQHGLWQFGGDRYGLRGYPSTNGTIIDDFGSANAIQMAQPGIRLDQFHLYNVAVRQGERIARFNGVKGFETETNTVAWAPWFSIGSDGNFFNGDIAEILVFGRTLESGERYSVEKYLNDKYGFVLTVPDSPSHVSAEALSASQVCVRWDPCSGAFGTRFVVERSTNGATFSAVGIVEDGCHYLDTNAVSGVNFFYRVKAVNCVGESACSDLVCASPGNGTTVPLNDTLLWLRADSLGLSNGAPVQCWNDWSGKGNYAFQSNSAGQPLYLTNSLNGHPVVHFDGVDDALSFPGIFSGATGAEFFVVWRRNGTNSENGGLSFGQQGSQYPRNDGQIVEGFDSVAGRALGVPLQPLSQFHFYNVQADSSNWVARINGTTIFEDANTDFAASESPAVGTAERPFSGDIAEIIVFGRTLSSDERSAVEVYINKRYLLVSDTQPPLAISVGTNEGGAPTISWSAITNASGFLVERSIGTNGPFVTIAVLRRGDESSYIDTAPSCNLPYWYRVRVLNVNGVACISNAEPVRPTNPGDPPSVPPEEGPVGDNSAVRLRVHVPIQ